MRTVFKILSLGVLAAVLLVTSLAIVLRLFSPLPDISQRRDAAFTDPVRPSTLAAKIAIEAEGKRGKSGIYGLSTGPEAFASRYLLASSAQSTIDMQYYIWHRDISGLLLLDAMRAAADRGVHVRLLIDDLGTTELDSELAALDAHPNIEVRLFNPRTVRSLSFANYITDFMRINRRMHNKAMIVDKAATIVGGRNIGDEYFGAGYGEMFVDLDVLATGDVVTEVATDFERYFNAPSSYSAADILPASPDGLEHLKRAAADIAKTPEALTFIDSLKKTAVVTQLSAGALPLEWTAAKLVSDDPIKGLGKAQASGLLVNRLPQLLGKPEVSLDLVSAYFIPGALGTKTLNDIANNGAKVRILTNAQATTDVLLVHSGYARYRPSLLENKVALFELKPTETEPETNWSLSLGSASGASLHAKTFAVDGKRIFIGSFNFDPRSANLNCEMGLLIDSPQLASQMNHLFDADLARYAYQLDMMPDGAINWLEKTNTGTLRHPTEPHTQWAERLALRIIGVLPIEWML